MAMKMAKLEEGVEDFAAGSAQPVPAQSVPDVIRLHAASLFPQVQSFLDRLCNDPHSATMFEGDADTLRDVMALCKNIKAASEYFNKGSAPIEAQRNERALFERSFNLLSVSRELNEFDEYQNQLVQLSWDGWQAAIKSMGSGE